MSGLLFLVTIAAWLVACIWLSSFAARRTNNQTSKRVVSALTFFSLISLPFVDEVIGKYQFETLCQANGIESADVSKARGRRVKVEYSGYRLLTGTVLPIVEKDVLFRDADSGEVLIRHMNYRAEGGWLMRYTWLSMGSNHPMLFGGSSCDVRKEQAIFRTNSVTFLYK